MSSKEVAAVGAHSGGDHPALVRKLGTPVGLALGALTLRVQQLIAIQEIRDSRAYREADLTWDQYCMEVLGENPKKVEEDLSSAGALGAQMFAVAEWAGLKRADFRQLRRSETDELRLLRDSNELVMGEEVIPITAENRDRILEGFLEMLQREQKEKDEAKEQLAEAEATIAKGREQIEAKEGELEDRDNQLRVAANIISVMRHDHPIQSEAGALTFRLAELVTQMEEEEFDKGEAVRIYTRLSDQLTRLARYAHGATLDPEAALSRLSPEMQAVIRESDEEEDRQPFGSAVEWERGGEEAGDA